MLMAISTTEFLDALKKLHLLDAAQVDAVAKQVQGKNVEPRILAQKLIEKKLLTPYQVNQLLMGKGQQLLLGSYVLIDRLGEGGMGEVFRARHWKMDRVVAIKLIRKERLANETAVKRFQREARAAAQLDHPNVVHAFDADMVGDTHLFVMEYAEGVDLAQLVKSKGPLPVDAACDYIRQAALGLQHALEKGLVHRDIKPHNLLLASPSKKSPTSTVKILDMGLARVTQVDGEDSTSTLTQEGAVMGTPDYIAPEQAMGAHDVDIRADLYSLGCTLYFLLTGQPPFPGGTLGAKLVQHQLEEPTPVEKLRPDVPRNVAAVVRKLMAKKPEKRFQTPAELAAALGGGAGSATLASGVAAAPRGARRLLFVGTAGTLLLGLLVLIVGMVLLSGGGDTRKASVSAQPTKPAEPPKEITNSIQMKLTYIPAGEFTMGSPGTEANREEREGPQHKVRITRAFYMGAYEVKQREYQAVMSDNPSSFKDSADHPVENVDWNKAMEFCKKLTDRPDEKKANRVYRLPTEAEWEYACRAGTTTVFHYGNSLSSKQANFNGGQPYGGAEKSLHIGKTVNCGNYAPNAWGLFDMHGNVWEWCLDDARPYTANAVDDPRGPEPAGGSRVHRGGSWYGEGFLCRAAYRIPVATSYRGLNVGFRVVCELQPEPIINSIGMKLAYIPAGEFTMGSPDTEANRETPEGPQHKVKITKAFYLGAYEVKQREYQEVMGENPSNFKDSADHPVEQVDWNKAMEFCKKLTERSDEKKLGQVYRLPTEAEWEYACRAGTTTVFHYGNSLSSQQANFRADQPYGGAKPGPNVGKTKKCGSYEANRWGLYDMHGNVWEWCLDDARPYTANPVEDPRGPETAGGSRVLRGGSWSYGGVFCRAARRDPNAPSFRVNGVGFRVVLVR